MDSLTRTIVNKNKKFNDKMQTLDINTPNLILTPLTCASLISEILKCLIFEKSLIPYPYNWLKNVVVENKKSNVSHESIKYVTGDKNRVALAAFDATENIMSNINRLFKLGNKITELLILIGATPLNPKEVYRINIPKIAKGHNECNHYGMIAKYQPRLLRSLLLSEEWMLKMEQPVPLTNLYVFVKIASGYSFLVDNNTVENFVPSTSFFIPKSAQSLTINLLYDDNVFHNCCANLTVYEDKCVEEIEEKMKDDSTEEEINKNDLLELNVEWLQANSILKGFK